MVEQRLEVAQGEEDQRLDLFLSQRLSDLSRSRIQRLIKGGAILLNGQPARPSQLVAPGDCITLRLAEPPSSEPQPQPLPLEILYEDESLLVINKPAGMVVHPAPGHTGDTLVNALLHHRPALAQAGLTPQRPGIVHRLDRDTSGLLLVAANPTALEALQRAFRRREVEKHYLALVYGAVAPLQAAIEAPIARDPANRLRMAVVEGGRYARTEYTVLEHLSGASLLDVNLLTGRTHQIRVHLASIGFPVVGDRTYGHRRESIRAPRQMLHAARLSLRHPQSGVPLCFEAPLPEDFVGVLQSLRKR